MVRTLKRQEGANNLKQIIQNNTRTTKMTTSLIDLILTNAHYIQRCGTLDTFMSDHQPIYVIKKKAKSRKIKVEFVGRSYKNYNKEKMSENLLRADWESYYNLGTVDEKWGYISDKLLEETDKMCPLTKCSFRQTKPPYITDGLMNQMKDRDYFYKKAKKYGNEDDWNIAKFLRNETNRNLKQAKADYLKTQLRINQNDSSKFWRTIKTVFSSNKTKTQSNIKLDDKGVSLKDNEVADYINDFFINVGNTTLSRGKVVTVPDHAPTDPDVELLEFDQAPKFQIYTLTKELSINKSSGMSTLSPQLVKDSLITLNGQFTHLVNESLTNSDFPDSLKSATVIPIPKQGDLSQVQNYRPISLLPIPGKIIERVVHQQVSFHLEERQLITNQQYGFRKGRSTIQATTNLLNHINVNLNNRKVTLALYIDFKKAFDCLQYSVLLEKLPLLGMHQQVISWISEYLTNRTQSTFANNTSSSHKAIRQGVPQGSILGPLLYIIYANDIAQKLTKCKYTFYADDTVLYFSSKNIEKAFENMQSDLDALSQWCSENGVYINTKKTKYMIFSNKKVDSVSPDGTLKFDLTVDNNSIDRVSSYNYLGITLDEQLSFELHVKNIISRVSNKVFQLRKLRKYLTNNSALLVYKNMILPLMEYGDIYLYSATKECRKNLQTLQNKALKCALGKDRMFGTIELHKEAKLNKLITRRKIHLLLHMYQNSKLPSFRGWKATKRIITRSSKKKLMTTRKPNTTRFQESITCKGPNMWNALPADLQKIESYRQFKLRLSDYILGGGRDKVGKVGGRKKKNQRKREPGKRV